jgi:uncharacterized membrane protein YphA (DoxX/SURF4 family)
MTIFTLVLYVAIVAVLLTALTQFVLKKVISLPVSFLQHFCGALFVFSGFVKAVDPLGTAYKMEQYFAKFESIFADTYASFLAPLFPFLTKYVNGFSVFMIVFEILLGVMLMIGAQRRFTAWAFLLLVLFFTVLTGFTYLTGYVPPDANFFSFGKWGAFNEANMQVTDCGCFGDFLKLKPKVSFLKDIFLLVPALIFVLRFRKMHQLFGRGTRAVLNGLTTAGFLLYCFQNFIWDIPSINFRPFKPGVDVVARKKLEEDALSKVRVIAYKITDRKTSKTIELPFEQYMKEYEKYPEEKFELKQIKSEPTMEKTKISDFSLTGPDGSDFTNFWMEIKGYHFMVVAYKLYGEAGPTSTETVQDSVFKMQAGPKGDSIRVFERLNSREISKSTFIYDEDYLNRWKSVINPALDAAKKDKVITYGITAPYDPAKIDDFKAKSGFDHLMIRADDILLKTIVRSNPGILLFKDGKIIEDWHWKKFPGYAAVKAKYMK